MLLRSQPDLFTQLTPDYNRHSGNQEILEENRQHFSTQAIKVLRHLANGEKVSGEMMHRLHGIQDYRPRIAALRKLFALIPSKIPGGKGAKQWEMKETDRPKAIEYLRKIGV